MNAKEQQWRQAIPGERILANQVHIYRADLGLSNAQIEGLLHLLSPDELDRAGRFRFEKDKDHYVAARGMLRQLLGGYLNISPRALRFEYTSRGKPFLAGNSVALDFNLSHSGSLVLYAVAHHRNIGVDIEQVTNAVGALHIAHRFFSAGEIGLLRNLPADKLQATFFKLWTRKEAFLKANGAGISFPMETVDVSLISGDTLSRITFDDDDNAVAGWYVQDVFPAEGYVAAIATDSSDCDISCFQYSV